MVGYTIFCFFYDEVEDIIKLTKRKYDKNDEIHDEKVYNQVRNINKYKSDTPLQLKEEDQFIVQDYEEAEVEGAICSDDAEEEDIIKNFYENDDEDLLSII